MNRINRTYPDRDFTLLSNTVFKSGLSARAIGLLCYIMSLPRDWVLYKTWIYQKLPEGREAINKAWQELEEKKFIICVKSNGAGRGRLPETNYFVCDDPDKHDVFSDAENTHAKVPTPKTRVRKSRNLQRTSEHSTIEQSTIPLMSNDINGAPGAEPITDKQPEQPNTPPDPTPPPQDEKLKTIYPRFIAIYDTWFKGFHDGVPPNYANGNGNAAKALILYFKKIAGERSKKDGIVLDEAGLEAKALEGWQYVLNSWGKLDNFLQAKTRLVDINSNVQNIITQIKNGHSKTNTTNGKRATGGDVSINDLAGKVAAFTAANGNR
jgi:hypothetical protein